MIFIPGAKFEALEFQIFKNPMWMDLFNESLFNFAKALEFQIFKNPLWSFFYIFSVGVFMIHAYLGWKKVTPVLGIPRGHIT